jgi:hypothetical protein
VVVIDTPPLLTHSDALLLAAAADHAVLVAEAGQTRPKTLEAAVASLRSTTVNLLGVVLHGGDHERVAVQSRLQPRLQRLSTSLSPSRLTRYLTLLQARLTLAMRPSRWMFGIGLMLVLLFIGFWTARYTDGLASFLEPTPTSVAVRLGHTETTFQAKAEATTGSETITGELVTAGSASTATADALPTAIIASVPTSTAFGALSSIPSPARPSSLRTIFEQVFSEVQPGWPDNTRSTAWFADGLYRLFARQPGQFVAIGAPLAEPLQDAVVSATFRKLGGAPGGGYGLIVRDQGPGPRDGMNQTGSFYVLEIGDRGEVGVLRRNDDRWIDLLPRTPSEAVRPGGSPNLLVARAMGQEVVFIVNGMQVATIAQLAPQAGTVGIFVAGDFNQVALERFVVQVPG